MQNFDLVINEGVSTTNINDFLVNKCLNYSSFQFKIFIESKDNYADTICVKRDAENKFQLFVRFIELDITYTSMMVNSLSEILYLMYKFPLTSSFPVYSIDIHAFETIDDLDDYLFKTVDAKTPFFLSVRLTDFLWDLVYVSGATVNGIPEDRDALEKVSICYYGKFVLSGDMEGKWKDLLNRMFDYHSVPAVMSVEYDFDSIFEQSDSEKDRIKELKSVVSVDSTTNVEFTIEEITRVRWIVKFYSDILSGSVTYKDIAAIFPASYVASLECKKNLEFVNDLYAKLCESVDSDADLA